MLNSLSSLQRLHCRLAGLPVDRAPNFDIIMTYGAHYIGARLRDYYLDHRVLARANIAMLEAFDLDIVQTILLHYHHLRGRLPLYLARYHPKLSYLGVLSGRQCHRQPEFFG